MPKLILIDRVPQLSAEPSKAGTLSSDDPLDLEIIPNLSSCQNKLRKKNDMKSNETRNFKNKVRNCRKNRKVEATIKIVKIEPLQKKIIMKLKITAKK